MDNETTNLDQTILEVIGSKANVSLSQAITNAEKSIGNNSFAVAVFASYQNGYLGYIVILGTSEKGIYYVVVDTDNGRILSRENITRRTTKETQFTYG
ncbi:hypothetical protein BH23THE1_BH23THE1_14580 [soil metagenome]